MTNLDPTVVGSLPTKPYRGEGLGQQAPKYDPVSAEGARRRGGRFNPPQSFPVLYLCTARAFTVAEFVRAGNRLGDRGPRACYLGSFSGMKMELDRIVDLTDPSTLEGLASPKATW
jgi:RES domain-containing protein